MRYKRHLLLKEIGADGQERLRSSSVLLVGVGGLGSPIALYLAAAGVGRIGLVDDDVVMLSNLQRQVLYEESEIGLPKVDCAARRLRAHASDLCVDAYPVRLTCANAAELIAPYDLVVDGCDNYQTRYLMNDVCRTQGKPYVYGSIGEFAGQVSVFNYEGGGDYRALYPEESFLIEKPPIETGVMGTVPGVIGCIEATEVIKIITRCGEVLRNKLFTMDLLTMQTAVYDIC